jgi:DNA-3-methyladenine glycosylase II
MERILKQWKKGAATLRQREPLLVEVIDKVGEPKLTLRLDPWESLVRSIVSQQLSTASARAIILKFEALHPPFPGPNQVRRFKAPRLAAAGFSKQKIQYLQSLSEHWDRLPKTRQAWESHSEEQVQELLTEVKGIGDWTAHMFQIFCLGRTNILPVGDYGVQKGLQLLHGLPDLPKPKQVAELVQHWDGVYSVGAWYLWRGLDLKLITRRPAPITS